MTTDTGRTTWSRLRDWMARIDDLAVAARMLEWDRETIMPAAASTGRGHQIGTLHTLRHREILAPGIDEVIEDAAAEPDLTPAERRMVELAHRARTRAERIPEALVREVSEATTACVASWLEHRPTGDFVAFAPALERVVDSMREWGTALDVGAEAYDGLLDEHEPGMRTADLEPLFERLSNEIGALLATVPDRPDIGIPLDRTWADREQFALAKDLAGMCGFTFDSGLVSRSVHPFTTSPGIGDVRFTTRIDPADPTVNALVTLHEAGHALYAQGHPTEHARTLVYGSPSLGAEESQARFLENHVGRTPELWRWLHPRLTDRFPAAMDGIGADDLHAHVTRVSPGWCRVDADELTYDLHIALRFGLEREMIRDRLAVADLSEAWDAGMRRLLGVAPTGDRQGCMQDIHWALGGFGYFPTYTIGNLYAAQIHEAMERDLGPVADLVARGELREMTRFLRERIHRMGSILPTERLMREATGMEFSVEPFLRRARRLALAAR